MQFHIIIPARYASTRLPGKPLRLLAGKPIVQHVFEQAQKSQAKSIIIATDDARIKQVAEEFGAEVCMTSSEHNSGTERLAEVIDTKGIPEDEIILNLQGDEPMMPSACLDQVASLLLRNTDCVMASLCEAVTTAEDLFDPNVVKVVLNKDKHAIYFSRAALPWHREAFANNNRVLPVEADLYYRHIGLYAYRAGFIKKYLELEVSPIEKVELLEQLRVLWHDYKIAMDVAWQTPGPGIDTEDDLKKVEKLLRG